MATLLMWDDIDITLLPPGYSAYAGYVNGRWPTAAAIRAKYPNAHILTIDVNASNIAANCLDVEPGDATNATAAVWTKAKLAAGNGKPVLYTSAGNVAALTSTLASAGISRPQYLVWSAHYTNSSHICAPGGCGYPAVDGTQFTSTAMGHSLDESLVSDSFFGAVVTPAAFPISSGASGAEVATLQDMLNKWGFYTGLSSPLTADGSFGPATLAAVRLALEYFGYSAANVAKGQVDASLWGHLLHDPAKFPFGKGTADADPAGPVHKVQQNLNRWSGQIKLATPLAVDGSFGSGTEAAVKLALAHFGYSAVNVAKGQVDSSLWNHLADAVPVAPPVVPKPVPYPAPSGLSVGRDVTVTLSWQPVSLNGKAAPGYIVAVYQKDGKIVHTVPVSSTSVSLKLVRGWQYQAHVWASGGPVSPPHAPVDFTA